MVKINISNFIINEKRHVVILCLFLFLIGSSFSIAGDKNCACNGTIKKIQSSKSSTAALNGFVLDQPGGKAVKNAIVCLWFDQNIVVKTKTNKKGEFNFKNLPSGDYSLAVCFENKPVADISGIQLTNGKSIFLNVFLKGHDSWSN